MAATFSSTSTRITISGNYKAFTGASGSTTTVIQYSSGDAPASGDAGRFLLWKNGAATKDWEIRFIESATSSTVTVGDGGYSSAPPSGSTFAISTNLDDVVSALAAATVNNFSYNFNGRDWQLSSGAFLADVNKSLDTENQASTSSWQIGNECAIQFGRLDGGEANGSTITRQGCFITLNNSKTSANSNVFGNGGSEVSNGPIVNFYGCYIKSYTSTAANWAFVRGTGPIRMIGTIWDGPIGGAFYHSVSELADTKFRGNTNLTPAWSIRATFTRPVENAQFANALAAFKTFSTYTGVFRNTVFDLDSLPTVVFVSGQTTGGVTCIDCTTFDDSKITDSGSGFVHQGKSINYTITDANGTGLTGAKVAVYDTDGTLQTGIQTSSSGAVSEIVATFYKWQDANPSSNKAPFDIRIRRYGYTYLGFQSAVSEPIKQEVRLVVNPDIVSTEAQAAAITGISLNFATETVTITQDADTQKLYDYYQYQLDQTANMIYGEDLVRAGNSFDLDDWDMVVDGCDYEGDATTTGLITLINGATFTGTRTDTNGTVLPLRNVSITGITAGSRLQIYNVTTAAEVVNTTVAGTSYTATYAEGTGYNSGDTVRIRLTQMSTTTAKLPLEATALATDAGWAALVSQEDDTVYNTFAVDGSTVTTFTADYTNDQVDVTVASDFNLSDMYAWWVYNLTTEQGIREFFGGLAAEDQANFRINTTVLSLFLDNTTNTEIIQLDNRRLYRTDLTYPVVRPSTGGGGIDIQWRDQILIAQTGISGLTPSESAALTAINTNVSSVLEDTGTTLPNQISTLSTDITGVEADLVTINQGVKKASLLIPHTTDL